MRFLPPLWVKYKGAMAATIALLFLIGMAAAWGNWKLLERARMEEQLHALEKEALRLEYTNDRMRHHLRRMRSDRRYLERFIRENLGWVKEDEVLYRFPHERLRREQPWWYDPQGEDGALALAAPQPSGPVSPGGWR